MGAIEWHSYNCIILQGVSSVIGRAFFLSGALLLSSCSQSPESPLDGDWIVNSDESRLAFVSIKNGEIVEAHGFRTMTGSISDQGVAKVIIDLTSVETNIEVRNERLREYLFEVDAFPTATVTAQVNPADFAKLEIGGELIKTVTANLDLHGVESELEAKLAVTRIGPDKVQVETNTPIIVDAGTFSLDNGVEKLRELAGLSGITPQVPVTFSIVFSRQDDAR